MAITVETGAVAVYCASSIGKQKAYTNAATSLGHALGSSSRPLVYGGGSKGIMGVVSGAVLEKGGQVLGVVPAAMVKAGGEGDKGEEESGAVHVVLNEEGREMVETIVVQSMHERKVEMAKRAVGFMGLPGGFGTFEEIMEVITWTQLGIHNKPVILINVLNFYEPLRQLIRRAVSEGFIQPHNEQLAIFVDGPSDESEHGTFDWGKAALDALDGWKRDRKGMFEWREGSIGGLESS
ncbi:uncharacterized protein STEHIDRAFT_73452 [Stereum hirsutum FP-91666 SS1]|uniref:uncharacterized protein n=1 Tax=Stereum hirsutum (strain FP-91666) TaxID=721885 RepID=UPI000440A3EB|nr:uncharacterized protein STEHIDRAFT_73452 [Stereum hirsutum FP-91666 SS1]EIM91535.1 hypothetical protein STEHIDRAFT_73452 [Stereum hirsutum FP-91666 SS1]